MYLSVSAIGAGVLSLPYVISQTGLVLGCAIVCLSTFCFKLLFEIFAAAVLAGYSLELLVTCGYYTGCRSYRLN